VRLSDRSTRVPGSAWLRLYPRDWRERYEAELLAMLETRPIDPRGRLDLARGALDAHVHPLTLPGPPVVAALVAGVAWIAAGLASALQPLMPDWPGFLFETLPVGIVGALAGLRATWRLGRRSGLDAPRGTGPALILAAIGYAAWVAALVLAFLGGPYGATTGAAAALAAVGTVAVGIVRSRAGDHPSAEGLLLVGGALLVPSPIAWVVAGGAWVGLGLAGLRPVPPSPSRLA
jgi:hypothetical protein